MQNRLWQQSALQPKLVLLHQNVAWHAAGVLKIFSLQKKVSGARCSRACSRGVKSLSFSSAAACRATLQSESASFLPVTHITATIWVKCEFESASGTHRCVPHNWTVDTLMAVPNIVLVPAMFLYTIPTYQILWKSQFIQQQFWEIPNLAFVAMS